MLLAKKIGNHSAKCRVKQTDPVALQQRECHILTITHFEITPMTAAGRLPSLMRRRPEALKPSSNAGRNAALSRRHRSMSALHPGHRVGPSAHPDAMLVMGSRDPAHHQGQGLKKCGCDQHRRRYRHAAARSFTRATFCCAAWPSREMASPTWLTPAPNCW